ncbi:MULTISPECIES: hypothetical protein [Actinoplanes]|uniref:hypothetical protein n=1 Tax=Actinoplanes TaxID=1865 RepID=UPI0005F286E6|nr:MULTISPECIES: hypothetical protein [Actinoplanes]GLY03826.1 hypothetical protein Acsp01_42050 [Actinoplanes sp. NBRC 101535]
MEDPDFLLSVITRLAAIPRPPTSDGERRAADLIRDDLAAALVPAPGYSADRPPVGGPDPAHSS